MYVRAHSRLHNALVRKLETGNGNIKGMKLLVVVEEEALVPIRVLGISFGRATCDGVAVLVKPVNGYGTLSVAATELLDDTKAARDRYAAKSKAAQYLRKFTPKESASDKTWRVATLQERAALSEKQRVRFDELAPKHFREKLDMVDGIKTATAWELKKLFVKAVQIRFGADESADDFESED